MVASVLRQRIIDGTLGEGGLLPKQEDMLKEFNVSKPSMREALRILETEGLVTVRRGNVGGAVSHVPTSRTAAYTIGLVLESRSVPLADVGHALALVEPMCAGMCASREDRAEAVVPILREAHEQARDQRDDLPTFAASMRRFHELLVELCGNETMIVVVGSLESLWSHGEAEWAATADTAGTAPTDLHGPTSLSAHEQLLELIVRGDASAVRELARAHLERTLFYVDASAAEVRVSSSPLRAPDGLHDHQRRDT
jgi:DNA-binding FadR family transcriptional regulator